MSMKSCRVLLILAVIMLGFCAVLIGVMLLPYSLILLPIMAWANRKGFWSWAHGTARWADADDLQRAGMLGIDHGIILGRVETETSITSGVKALFDFKRPAGEACEEFFRGLRRKPRSDMVRLAKAVH